MNKQREPLKNRIRLVVQAASLIGLSLCSLSLVLAAAPALEVQFKGQKFKQPVAMLQAPGDSVNWYVVEQPGRVARLTPDGKRNWFIDITDRVESGPNEAGLLGMAFHPQYQNNAEVFLSYTRDGDPLVSYVSRFLLDKSSNTLKPDSEQVIITVAQPYGNHNGGQISFDPAGYLMIGLGDGGSGGDPKNNGQNPRTLLGAMLRLDVDKAKPYAIPKDNPFADGKQGAPEVYAYGLRNPWRWSFDRLNGELWLADVGQNKWEEINKIIAGGNYGWNYREGRHCYTRGRCDTPGLIEPVAEYSHADGCSITGGYVYRGKAIKELVGSYLYADYCNGNIWALNSNDGKTYQAKLILESGQNISSFAEGHDAELYVLGHRSGLVYRLTPGKH